MNAADAAEYIIIHSPGGGVIESCQDDPVEVDLCDRTLEDGSFVDVPSGAPCSGVDTSPAPVEVLAPIPPPAFLSTLSAAEADPPRRMSMADGGLWW